MRITTIDLVQQDVCHYTLSDYYVRTFYCLGTTYTWIAMNLQLPVVIKNRWL